MAFQSTSEFEQQQVPAEPSGSKRVFLLALAVFASLGFLMYYSRLLTPGGQMGVDHPGVGQPLTALNLEPFLDAGPTVKLAAVRGRVTLINYWGPWCPPCRMEMPHMVEIEQKYRDVEAFQFLSVACGAWVYESLDDMRKETAKYRDQEKLEFPIYFDPEFTSRDGLESDLGKQPHSLAYPTTVVIDQQGQIAGAWQGFAPEVPKQIMACIDRLIARS